jgi:Lrp/AsnC family leucine-responsive transcriptional regulator
MDRIDKKILELLQMNSHVNNQELADKVALSPSPCLRRVKQLEEEGYISKYVALLNPKKIGLELTIFVLVGLNTHDAKKMAGFEKIIKACPEIIQCYLITGHSADYILKIIVRDLNQYQSFLLNTLTKIESVQHVHSSFALQKIVDKTELPLNGLISQ